MTLLTNNGSQYKNSQYHISYIAKWWWGKVWRIWQLRSNSPKLQVDKNSLWQMNVKQIAEISQGTLVAKGQPLSAHHFSGIHSITATAYVCNSWIAQFSFTRKLCSIIWSISDIFVLVLSPSPHSTLQTHAPYSTACDDEINDCDFCNSPKLSPPNP